MSVILLIQNTLSRVLDVYALAAQIVANLILNGWYVIVQDAAKLTTDIHDLLNDPTCGQEAQCNQLTTILSDISALSMAIAALGNPQQTGSAVTLPSPAPSGYGAVNGDIADAVWNYSTPDGASYSATLDALTRAGNFADRVNGHAAFVTGSSQCVRLVGPWSTQRTGLFPAFVDSVDPSTILASDTTVLDWLNRVFGGGWTQLFGQPYPHTVDSSGNYTCYVTISQPEFELLRALNAGTALPGASPPVWPGLAHVTLGSSHAIAAPGEVITVDCDGVIVEITGTPSWAGKFEFGSATSWRNIGAMSFTSDNGQEEFPQTWGFANVVYLPKSMAHASGYAYRAAIGVTGTLTPFVIN